MYSIPIALYLRVCGSRRNHYFPVSHHAFFTVILQHERQGLKRRLGDADVTAAARSAAEKKVQDLEDAIDGLKQRTQRTIDDLQRKKDQAESSRDLFWRHYMGADQERKKEEQARQASDQRVHEMTQNWRRLEAALALERLVK